MFLFLAQSHFDLIIAQFMVINVVDGYDHYVILSVDYVNAQRLESVAKFDECLFGNNRNNLSILAFDENSMNRMHIVTAVTNQF